jgi:hypothetical protein
VTWGIYQHMIAAYREPDRKRGRELMQQVIGSIGHSVPTALREVVTLGRTPKRRAVDVLAYFGRPGTSNGPTEAINGRFLYQRLQGRLRRVSVVGPTRTCSETRSHGTLWSWGRRLEANGDVGLSDGRYCWRPPSPLLPASRVC